jgi:hypothetical protein
MGFVMLTAIPMVSVLNVALLATPTNSTKEAKALKPNRTRIEKPNQDQKPTIKNNNPNHQE